MSRYLHALDPRRSLATAVAWFAVVLSLAIALALLAVGDFAVNSMLAQRDAQMMRFATQLADALERAAAEERPGLALPPPERLDVLVDAVREQAKPDPRARVLLLDPRHDILFARPAGPADVPLTMPGGSLQVGGDGEHVVVVTAPLDAAPTLRSLGIRIAVVQPSEEGGHGGQVQEKLTAISILLSIVAAVIGAAFARRLTRRLKNLTVQAQLVAHQSAEGLVEPAGLDEVAVLGRAFGRLLRALRAERDELDRLTRELEQRVQVRTREVERLAADSRYAAVVRERLRLARDLHDTLAHSMMAMLTEIRVLKHMAVSKPEALPDELVRAEQAAREGLREARLAIDQLRSNPVRDLGLGAALAEQAKALSERSGIALDCRIDAELAGLAAQPADTVYRMCEEMLRNVERHAGAQRLRVELARSQDGGSVELEIADDGVGFEPGIGATGHYGLVGLAEQAEAIGAEMSIASRPGAGTRIRLRWAPRELVPIT